MMTTILLKTNNLQKRGEGRETLRGIDLALLPGEFLTLLAKKDDAAKTALVRILSGLDRPDFCRVLLGGRDITDVPPQRREMNAVFAATPLFPHRNIYQNVAYGLSRHQISRKERRERVKAILEEMGLSGLEDKKPHQLTPIKQRLAVLCRALALRPQVLLLDDPFSGLDDFDRREALSSLKSIQKLWHLPMLYITSDREEAMASSGRAALMVDGRIEQLGTPGELYARPVSVCAARMTGATNLLPCVVAARRPGGLVALDMEGLTLSPGFRPASQHGGGSVRMPEAGDGAPVLGPRPGQPDERRLYRPKGRG
jgi:spermidine/putrescine transport system ATP-binding protein